MTHQPSLSTRTNSCIPTRVACITDSRCHHPRHDGLELNIQLPDFDVNIPSCPACPPAPACPSVPACPPCPSYPQPKPDTGTDIGTKPKAKEPFDMGKLAILTPSGEDEILDVNTNKRTGMYSKKCGEIIKNTKNDLEILNGKIVGKCYDSPECDKCVDALNSGIIRVLSSEDQPFFSDHSIPTLEGNVYIL